MFTLKVIKKDSTQYKYHLKLLLSLFLS
jgi:hypothetical protein